jgi:hypothetical protein
MTPEELYKFVKDNAEAIKADAEAGNSDAKNIITTYNMLTRFVENGALGILAGAIEDWKAGRESASTDELLCPVCKKEIATTESTVDWRSETTIRCCADCYDLLSKAQRLQAQGRMSKSFLAQYQERLSNATDELLAEYTRLYGMKGKANERP